MRHAPKPAHWRRRAMEWFVSHDTGISSETIWSVMTRWPVSRVGTPSDPSDFGRCHRLLELFPSWRRRLHLVGEKYPAWRPFVREWSDLTALYLRDLPTGSSFDLWEAQERLQIEGGVYKGPPAVPRIRAQATAHAAAEQAKRAARNARRRSRVSP